MIGSSLLSFRGNPGTLVNRTGRSQSATGRVIRVKHTGSGADVVARITRR
jgi:hypothetical protein